MVERLRAWRERLDRGTVGASCRLFGVVERGQQILSAAQGTLWDEIATGGEPANGLVGAGGRGLTIATATGLHLVDARRRVQRSVAWDDLCNVSLAPSLEAVILRPAAPQAPATAICRPRIRFLPGGRGLALAKLLTIEASWHAARGELDAWYGGLPERLAIGLRAPERPLRP